MPRASFDGECNLNDSGEFSKSFHVIFPNELQLKRKHQGLHVTFLDPDITDVDVIYEYKLYDMKDDYTFLLSEVLFVCQT